MKSLPRSEKFKKTLNDELDNLEFWEAFGKPVTITKADRVSNLARFLVWNKEEPHSLRLTESAVIEHGHVITFEAFLKLVDDCELLDFSNLNSESINHPNIPGYQPSDGDLYVIRTRNANSKLKRFRDLLEGDLEKIEFWDVEGVLVTFSKSKSKLPFVVIAWDSEGGRQFPVDSVLRNGTPITYEVFLQSFKDGLSS